VFNKQAGSEVAQEVGSGMQGTADAVSMPAAAQTMRRKPGSVKLALAGRDPNKQAVMCRTAGADVFRRKPDEFKSSLTGRDPPTQPVMCQTTGADINARSQTQ
jgi:hypothetical protein